MNPELTSKDEERTRLLEEVRPVKSRELRALLWVVGSVSLVLGLIGVFLPVLPTTPFLLLAAACYARASAKFYVWLMMLPVVGEPLRQWRSERKLRRSTKAKAITLLWLTLGTSIIFFVRPPWAKIAAGLVGLGVTAYLLRIPNKY